jgi:hypothetical protein
MKDDYTLTPDEMEALSNSYDDGYLKGMQDEQARHRMPIPDDVRDAIEALYYFARLFPNIAPCDGEVETVKAWLNALPQEPEAPAVDWSKVPEVVRPDEYNQEWGE